MGNFKSLAQLNYWVARGSNKTNIGIGQARVRLAVSSWNLLRTTTRPMIFTSLKPLWMLSGRIGIAITSRNAMAHSTLSFAIRHVVFSGTKKEMLRIDAISDIAAMTNINAFWYWSAIKNPGSSMGACVHLAKTNYAIPVTRMSRLPEPTLFISALGKFSLKPFSFIHSNAVTYTWPEGNT